MLRRSWRAGWPAHLFLLGVVALNSLALIIPIGSPLLALLLFADVLAVSAALLVVQRQAARHIAGLRQFIAILAQLVEFRDGAVGQHSQEVGLWSRRLAERMGLPADAIDDIELAGILHDIGKIGVPDRVLHKPGPLDEEEWVLMRRHVLISAAVTTELPDVSIDLIRGVAGHHERWDGSGYPLGLRGQALALAAQIIGLVDTWCALREDRPYRRGHSIAQARAILESLDDRGLFQPGLVPLFLSILPDEALDPLDP